MINFSLHWMCEPTLCARRCAPIRCWCAHHILDIVWKMWKKIMRTSINLVCISCRYRGVTKTPQPKRIHSKLNQYNKTDKNKQLNVRVSSTPQTYCQKETACHMKLAISQTACTGSCSYLWHYRLILIVFISFGFHFLFFVFTASTPM